MFDAHAAGISPGATFVEGGRKCRVELLLESTFPACELDTPLVEIGVERGALIEECESKCVLECGRA